MVAELVVYRRIISAEERAAARRTKSGSTVARETAKWNGESGGLFRLDRAWLTPLVLLEKLSSAANGRAGRYSARGCAHTRALTRS